MRSRQWSYIALLVLFFGAWLALGVSLESEAANAQGAFPTHEIQAVVPFPAGGAVDAAVRILRPQLSSNLGVPVVVINRPGAGGMIGTGLVANAKPDGYIVAATPSTTMTLIRLTQPNVPYKVNDLVPLGTYAVDVSAIVVRADSPWKTYDDLISYAIKNPGKLTYGSAGIGSVSSFMLKAIELHYGLKMVEVPFQGSPPANTALLGKHVDFATVAFSNAAPLVDAGKLRALVISGESRLSGHPNIPTLKEKKVPYASLVLTLGLYVPKRTPLPVIDRLAKALHIAVTNASTTAALKKLGLVVHYEDKDSAQRQRTAEYRSVTELGRKLNLAPAR